MTTERSVQGCHARDRIRSVILYGDRLRRAAFARRRLAYWLPKTTATAAAVVFLVALTDSPRIIGAAVMAALLAGVALLVVVARRRRPVDDAAAVELDTAARLGGMLRSAHWFAEEHRGEPSSPLLDLHLQQAADRAAGVDWRAVYRSPPVRSAWVKSFLATVMACVFLVWLPRGFVTPHWRVPPAAGGADRREDQGAVLPAALVPKLVEGLRALEAGEAPSREALAAIGQALELAARDAGARREIERLLASPRGQAAPTDVARNDRTSGEQSGGEDDESYNLSHDGLEFAYEEALARARASEARPEHRAPAPGAADADRTPSTSADPGREDATESGAAAEGKAALADARGQASSFSSLLFGRNSQDGGDGQNVAATPPERSSALTAALRNEVVHARGDSLGTLTERSGERRATTLNHAAADAAVVRPLAGYQPARGWQPPAIPDDRRTLVETYFARQAEADHARKQP